MFNPEEPTTKAMLNYIKTHWPELIENPQDVETADGLNKLQQKANLLLEESRQRMREKVENLKKDLVLSADCLKKLNILAGSLTRLQNALEILWLELQMARPPKKGA